MSTLPKAIDMFNAIPIKILMTLLKKLEKKYYKISMKLQRTPNSQSNLRKNNKAGGFTF